MEPHAGLGAVAPAVGAGLGCDQDVVFERGEEAAGAGEADVDAADGVGGVVYLLAQMVLTRSLVWRRCLLQAARTLQIRQTTC